MRSVIIHYHLFKNAGSTVDSILERSFGSSWRVLERAANAPWVNAEQLAGLAIRDPAVRAVSSHSARLPVPSDPRIAFHPIVFVRHPIDWVRSVYDFERRQRVATPGSRAAREMELVDYLRWRLRQAPNSAIANFHALWLLGGAEQSLRRGDISPAALSRAAALLLALPNFGVVERFAESAAMLRKNLAPHGLNLVAAYEVKNVTTERAKSLDERLAAMRRQLPDTLWDELMERNAADIELYRIACMEFERRLATPAQKNEPPIAAMSARAPDGNSIGGLDRPASHR